jgi:hypothetical protein
MKEDATLTPKTFPDPISIGHLRSFEPASDALFLIRYLGAYYQKDSIIISEFHL